MKVTVLGCGTSSGVPRMPEHWGACDPTNPKNTRRRVSVLVQKENTNILVDTSPDLRVQMLDAKVGHMDAVFYTHDHADHTHGIDDLRGFFQTARKEVPVYGDAKTLSILKQRFGYIFQSKDGYPAICTAHEMLDTVTIGAIEVSSFTQGHGPNTTSLGYRFGDFAYSTDVNALDEAAFAALAGVKVWVVDALRYEPHPTHSHLAQTLEWIARVKPDRAILTHMTNDMDYETLKNALPKGVDPAFDGMEIDV